jgi:hypothetical protein
LELSQHEHLAADRAKRRQGFAAQVNKIADAGDVDHCAVRAGFGENSGEARDHQP